jgi:hypothetical protein
MLVACVMTLLAAPVGAQTPVNLVANGDFTQVVNGKPVGWETAGDPQHVQQELTLVREEGRSCAKLTCTRIEGEGGSVHVMLAQVGVVRLQAGKLYQFHCRARQEGIRGSAASVAVSDMSIWDTCGLEASLDLEPRWREYTVFFRATRTVDKTSRLQIWFAETGSLYVTDVSITEAPAQRVEFTDTVPPTESPNLVPNGSFAAGSAGWGTAGISTGWGDMAHLHGYIVTSTERDHREFLRIPMGNGRTPVLGFDYYEPVLRPQTRALAANLRWIPVEAGAAYTLSADMRANVDGVRAALGYAALNPEDSQWNVRRDGQSVLLTTAWRRYSMTFTAPKSHLFVMAGPDLTEDMPVEVDVDSITLTRGAGPAAFAPHAPIELGVQPANAGGAIVLGEPAALIVSAANNEPSTQRITVRLQCRDYFDRPVPIKDLTMDLPPRGTVSRTVATSTSWRGWYGVRVSAVSASGKTVAVLTPEVRLSIVPKPKGPTILGMNHAFPDPFLIPLARMAGVSEYRDWSLKWEHMEPRPGEYHWELADAQIDRVLDAGASVMGLLPPFPSAEWSSTAPESLRTSSYPGERIRQAWAPKEPVALADFVGKAVRRYKDRIHVWEFLNEPIFTDYSLPRPQYKPTDYVALLRPVAAAIRDADPRARIIGGSADGPGGVTREMVAEGVLDLVDILNLHIYPGARAPEGYIAEMERLQAEMRRLGKVRPIWITEFSYYGADNLPRKPFLPEGSDWAQARLLNSEQQCADYTVRFCLIMLAHGCEKVFIHSGSCGSVNVPNFECCLFDYGGSPRKVASALGALTAALGPRPSAVAAPSLPDGVHAAVFETGSGSFAAVWALSPNMALHVPRGVRCTDMMGRLIAKPTVPLSGSPVYLFGVAGQAAKLIAHVGTL